jgi:hypothetical protein
VVRTFNAGLFGTDKFTDLSPRGVNAGYPEGVMMVIKIIRLTTTNNKTIPSIL